MQQFWVLEAIATCSVMSGMILPQSTATTLAMDCQLLGSFLLLRASNTSQCQKEFIEVQIFANIAAGGEQITDWQILDRLFASLWWIYVAKIIFTSSILKLKSRDISFSGRLTKTFVIVSIDHFCYLIVLTVVTTTAIPHLHLKLWLVTRKKYESTQAIMLSCCRTNIRNRHKLGFLL